MRGREEERRESEGKMREKEAGHSSRVAKVGGERWGEVVNWTLCLTSAAGGDAGTETEAARERGGDEELRGDPLQGNDCQCVSLSFEPSLKLSPHLTGGKGENGNTSNLPQVCTVKSR